MLRWSSACNTAGATASADFTVIRSSAKSILSTRAIACASSIADLRTGERMLAGLEDQPPIGLERLVAGIALDVDETDGDALWRDREHSVLGPRRRRQCDCTRRGKQAALQAL